MYPKQTKVPDVYTILTPLPQLILKRPIPAKVQDELSKEGFCFSPMNLQLYRNLVNPAKNNQCSDEIILLLQRTLEGGAIFWAKIPTPMPVSKLFSLNGIIYSAVADEILQRLFNCLLLFGYVPKPFRRSLWFLAKGEPEQRDIDTLALLEPSWNYYDWEIKYAESVQADYIIYCLLNNWNKLTSLAKISLLNELFTNQKKQEFYNKSGKDNILKKAEEMIKVRYGQDAHFVESDISEITSDSNEKEITTVHPPKISPQQSMKWFIQGWQSAYFKEVDKLIRKLKDVSGQRFIRAFQFFIDACRMSNPHRFVALTIPLETLFCVTSREITFQLSLRIAWFLEPDDFIKRNILFTFVQDLYGTRSKIVHGGKYDAGKIENTVGDLEDLDRRIFLKILSCDNLYKIMFDKNQESWEKYLDGLNLGKS